MLASLSEGIMINLLTTGRGPVPLTGRRVLSMPLMHPVLWPRAPLRMWRTAVASTRWSVRPSFCHVPSTTSAAGISSSGREQAKPGGGALRFDTQTRNPAPLQNLPTVSPDAQRLVKGA
jgi:hypothetical protein